MSVYRRYFRIKDAATLAEIDRIFDGIKQYNDKLQEIKEEIGAKSTHTYSRSGCLAGFGFENRPDSGLYREPERDIFYPKKTSKAGKEICKKIDAIKKPEEIDNALKVAGLACGFSGGMTSGMSFYMNTICGSDDAGWFASIPWQDLDPAEIEQYKADHDAGKRRNANMEHLLWVPPAEWEELKEWQVKKALDDSKGGEK